MHFCLCNAISDKDEVCEKHDVKSYLIPLRHAQSYSVHMCSFESASSTCENKNICNETAYYQLGSCTGTGIAGCDRSRLKSKRGDCYRFCHTQFLMQQDQYLKMKLILSVRGTSVQPPISNWNEWITLPFKANQTNEATRKVCILQTDMWRTRRAIYFACMRKVLVFAYTHTRI